MAVIQLRQQHTALTIDNANQVVIILLTKLAPGAYTRPPTVCVVGLGTELVALYGSSMSGLQCMGGHIMTEF